MWKRWPLFCLGSVWLSFVFLSSGHNSKKDLMSSSRDVRSYHTTQMSEWMPAGSGLWWELLVMCGGTRCERQLPKGRQINYSAWSFASARLRWQHMRGINSCNIHERTRRCLKATSWVRGAHMCAERQIAAHYGRIANRIITNDYDIFVFEMQVRVKTTKRCLMECLLCFCRAVDWLYCFQMILWILRSITFAYYLGKRCTESVSVILN